MSNKNKKTANKSAKQAEAYVHIIRVASFKKADKKGFLTPVNKRAHKLVKKLGKRTLVTAADLKQFDGYHDIKVYTTKGVRRTLQAL